MQLTPHLVRSTLSNSRLKTVKLDASTTELGNAFQGLDLQNILRQSYDYLTIMPELRSTYDGRLINKTSQEEARLFSGTIHLKNRNIVN